MLWHISPPFFFVGYQEYLYLKNIIEKRMMFIIVALDLFDSLV